MTSARSRMAPSTSSRGRTRFIRPSFGFSEDWNVQCAAHAPSAAPVGFVTQCVTEGKRSKKNCRSSISQLNDEQMANAARKDPRSPRHARTTNPTGTKQIRLVRLSFQRKAAQLRAKRLLYFRFTQY